MLSLEISFLSFQGTAFYIHRNFQPVTSRLLHDFEDLEFLMQLIAIFRFMFYLENLVVKIKTSSEGFKTVLSLWELKSAERRLATLPGTRATAMTTMLTACCFA